MRWRVAALGWELASASGCALLASANVHHNSRGTACVESPIPSLIDLLIAGATGVGIATSDDAHPGWFAVPAVFGATGLIGAVYAARCRGDDGKQVTRIVVPGNNTAPAFGDAPVDPEAREPSFEERVPAGTSPPPSPLFDRHGVPAGVMLPAPLTTPDPLTTPPASQPTSARHTTDPPPAGAPVVRCTLTPRVDCPDGYYCRLFAENTGTCEKI